MTLPMLTLYDYWRASSPYRVRIALNMKGLGYAQTSVHLAKDGGEQHAPAFRAVNPGGRVPALVLEDGRVLTQSLAIIEYLEEVHPEPALLPDAPVERAAIRAFAYALAMDVQPHHNLATLAALRARFGADEEAVRAWVAAACAPVFAGLEAQARGRGGEGWLFGAGPTLAETCLVPAVYAARRFGVELSPYPRLLEADALARDFAPIAAAAPERQPDAPAEPAPPA